MPTANLEVFEERTGSVGFVVPIPKLPLPSNLAISYNPCPNAIGSF